MVLRDHRLFAARFGGQQLRPATHCVTPNDFTCARRRPHARRLISAIGDLGGACQAQYPSIESRATFGLVRSRRGSSVPR